MTGLQFKEIRVWNGISQVKFGNIIGNRDRNYVYRLELLANVPVIYINALGKLIQEDLSDEIRAKKIAIMAHDALELRKKNQPQPKYPNKRYLGRPIYG